MFDMLKEIVVEALSRCAATARAVRLPCSASSGASSPSRCSSPTATDSAVSSSPPSNAFGKSAIICWPQQTSEQPGGQRAGKTVHFEKEDVEFIRATAPMVKYVCMETVQTLAIAYGDRLVNTAVRGVCPEYGDMRNEVASEGRWITPADEVERRRVVFLGSRVQRTALQRTPRRRRNRARSAACASPSSASWTEDPAQQLLHAATTAPPGSHTPPPEICGTRATPAVSSSRPLPRSSKNRPGATSGRHRRTPGLLADRQESHPDVRPRRVSPGHRRPHHRPAGPADLHRRAHARHRRRRRHEHHARLRR